MSAELKILLITAASIGFVHTLFGPDHYLPFIVMSKARKWNILTTSIITILCGIGHILGSVILGFVGIAFGVAISKLEFIEASRGEVAAWLFIIFGFTYFVWGLRRAILKKHHEHHHYHPSESDHSHKHCHTSDHLHLHDRKTYSSLTPWILFTIFVFGPCEPLIPVLMYPAAKGSLLAAAAVASVFGIVTIVTMLIVVLALSYGFAKLPMGKLERYSHAIAGLIIFLSGGAIKFLGL